MQVHRFYLADECGRFSGWERLRVRLEDGVLHIGKRVSLPLAHIQACEVAPTPKGKGELITILARSPALNDGQPTPIYLLSKSFFGVTKRAPMEAFVAELAPLIRDNAFDPADIPHPDVLRDAEAPTGTYEVTYALNVSGLFLYYRKEWLSFHSRRRAFLTTCLLMFLGPVLNCAGLLLVAIPVDNWKMSRNLSTAGVGKAGCLAVYIGSLLVWLAPVIAWVAVFVFILRS